MFRLLFSVLSANVLQKIYFETKRPNYMNYGGIGSVIGSDIIQGIQYWRTLKSSNNLLCIVDQYNKYSSKLFGDNVSRRFIRFVVSTRNY